MQDDLALQEKNRLRLLRRLYKITDRDRSKRHKIWDIGDELGFSLEETKKCDQYLKGEGWIEAAATGGVVKITHEGIKKVEAILEAEQAEAQAAGEDVAESAPDLWEPFEEHHLQSDQILIVKALIVARNHKLPWDYIAVNVLNLDENSKATIHSKFRSRPGVVGEEGSEALIWRSKKEPLHLCLNPNNT